MDIFTIIAYLRDLISTILSLLMMMSPVFGQTGEAYTAKNPDELITSFVVVSDIHVETNNPKSYENLQAVLEGVKGGEDIDAVFYTGDNVMNGQTLESLFFYSAVKAVMPAEKNYVLPGNHDFGNGEGDGAALQANFIANNKLYLGEDLEDIYYYRVINGCYMICLASEKLVADDFTMSQAQFDWLKGVLEQAKAENAPIFIFNHFPLECLDKESDIQHAQLSALINEYDVEFFAHGHYHNDLDAGNFYTYEGVKCINLPRITETVEFAPGDGIVVEVYENETIVRGRDFIKGEWIEGLEYTY